MTRPRSRMLRRARCSVPGRLYMLTTATHLRRPLFHNFYFARLVIQNLRYAEQQQHCRSLAWVVMPDHVHWLIELKDVTLGTLMQRFKCQSSNALRKAGAMAKPVWQTGYYDRALRRDEDILKAARYIVANPVRAGLVAKAGDYPHRDAVWLSSHGEGWIGGVALLKFSNVCLQTCMGCEIERRAGGARSQSPKGEH